MVYNGYYKVMSNIPKMGHLTTPVLTKITFYAQKEYLCNKKGTSLNLRARQNPRSTFSLIVFSRVNMYQPCHFGVPRFSLIATCLKPMPPCHAHQPTSHWTCPSPHHKVASRRWVIGEPSETTENEHVATKVERSFINIYHSCSKIVLFQSVLSFCWFLFIWWCKSNPVKAYQPAFRKSFLAPPPRFRLKLDSGAKLTTSISSVSSIVISGI